MNRKEVISSIALRTGQSAKSAEAMVAAFEQVLLEAVGRNEKVQLPGILTVERVERAARTGRNPQTGGTLEIPASKAPAFKPGKALKDAVN